MCHRVRPPWGCSRSSSLAGVFAPPWSRPLSAAAAAGGGEGEASVGCACFDLGMGRSADRFPGCKYAAYRLYGLGSSLYGRPAWRGGGVACRHGGVGCGRVVVPHICGCLVPGSDRRLQWPVSQRSSPAREVWRGSTPREVLSWHRAVHVWKDTALVGGPSRGLLRCFLGHRPGPRAGGLKSMPRIIERIPGKVPLGGSPLRCGRSSPHPTDLAIGSSPRVVWVPSSSSSAPAILFHPALPNRTLPPTTTGVG